MQIIETRNSFDSMTIALLLVVVVIGAVVVTDADVEVVLVVGDGVVDCKVVLVVDEGKTFPQIQSEKGSIRVNRRTVVHPSWELATPTSRYNSLSFK